MLSALHTSATRLALSLVLVMATVPAALARQNASTTEADLDAMLSATFAADAPGAAVVVVKDGKVVFRKGYGRASLELGTPMRPEMVFEIGSVTKQFTSTAVMMLVEQGKLALDDDVRKYLPYFPDKGAKITVEHLLTHTSGIQSYTGMPSFPTIWRKDMSPQEIVELTSNEPLEFPPGTKFNYNNTGYVMLGAIIEKVSGLSYADFIKKNIFDPLGMTHSVYGSHTDLIPNRASGYGRDESGWKNAQYLSLTLPYAAGSLMSSVDDLALWDAAVSSGKLLSKASWDRAFTPYKLASGESTGYGYGWGVETYEGHKMIRHSGGIPGYVSEVLRAPDDRVYVAMLTNSTAPPVNTGFLATKIAAIAIGKPYREPASVKLDAKILDSYTGVYRIDDTTTRAVMREGDRVFVQRSDRPKTEIFAANETEFFIKDSFQRFTFEKDASGRVTAVVSRQPDGKTERAPRTDQALPAAPVAITVSPDVLARYVGDYQLAPNFILTVTLEDGHLMTQATGQSKIEIFAKSETVFFPKVVEAEITFVTDATGKVDKLVLRQGGRDMDAPKVK